MKRHDYISWEQYFMEIARVSAQRSKDPDTQVGACIVDKDNRIVGIGYNGFPNRCSDDTLPWERDGDWLDTKYPYVVHAEANAILNCIGRGISLDGCVMYCTLAPCNECAKTIIQVGIKEVVFESNVGRTDKDYYIAACKLFDLAGVKLKEYK